MSDTTDDTPALREQPSFEPSTEVMRIAERFAPGSSGNRAGRPRGAERIREMLTPKSKALVDKVIELALAGDTTALRIAVDRLAPPLRADTPMVSIPALANAKTLSEKANAIVDAVGQSRITPDAAAMLLQAIAAAAKIVEADEVQRRLEALERRQQGYL